MNKVLILLNSNCLLSLIFTNYLIYFFFETKFFFLFFALVSLLNFFFILYTNLKKNLYLVLTVLTLFLISLGSPTIDWDARSIWLFNAKRIFYNENLIKYTDYFESEFSHLDYPILIQTFSATLAKLIGNWNDIFPKISNIIFALPALVILSKIINTKVEKIIFIVLIFFIYEKKIINGEMDALLSLYAVSCSVLVINFSKIEIIKSSHYFCLLLHLSALTMIKVEGIAILFTLLISFFVIFYNFKLRSHNYLIIIFILSLLPIGLWNNYIDSQNIISSSYLMISNGERFLKNLLNFKFILILINYIILNKQMIISLFILLIMLHKYILINQKKLFLTFRKDFFKTEIGFLNLSVIIYGSILFIIFIMSEGSPNNIFEIEFFMAITSSDRLLLPVHSLMILYSIYLNKKNSNRNLNLFNKF